MMPDVSRYMYKLAIDYVCPEGSVCVTYSNLDMCTKALETAGCLLSKTCVIAKECISTSSKLVGFIHECGSNSRTGEILEGPQRAVSVIKYFSVSERVSSVAQGLADKLPGLVVEFYKTNAAAVHLVGAATLGIAIGYAFRCFQHNSKVKQS